MEEISPLVAMVVKNALYLPLHVSTIWEVQGYVSSREEPLPSQHGCLINLNRFEEAIGQCSMVLSEDGNNVKALFRRGKAGAEHGQTDSAREDFHKAYKFASKDKTIAKELRLLAEQDKAVYQKQKEIYKGIFGARPEPKPKRLNWLILIWQWLMALFSSLFKKRKAD